jgi:hypothetical protein
MKPRTTPQDEIIDAVKQEEELVCQLCDAIKQRQLAEMRRTIGNRFNVTHHPVQSFVSQLLVQTLSNMQPLRMDWRP